MNRASQDTLVLHRTADILGGRWQILAPLADGGMGQVYTARHVRTGKQAAVKVLERDDPEALARFKLEASVAADVNHPGIVDVYDADVDEKTGRCFLAMELLHGRTLRATMDDPSSTPATLLALLMRALEPLVAAHRKGYVHRDLKPENIFVVSDGAQSRVKLLDFGIAGHDFQKGLTQTGMAMGTPHYMSPEQAMNAAQAQPAADVWSMGVLLYEALCGKPPFTGATAHAVVVHACTQDPTPLHQLESSVSPELSDVVMRCLSKDPADRPKDAEELRSALLRLNHPTSIPAYRVPSLRSRPTTDDPSQASVVDDAKAVAEVQPSPAPVPKLAPKKATLAALGSVVVFLLFSRVLTGSMHDLVLLGMELTGVALAGVGLFLLVRENREIAATPLQPTQPTPLQIPSYDEPDIPDTPETPPLSRGPNQALVRIELFVDLSVPLSRRVCEQVLLWQREHSDEVAIGLRLMPIGHDGIGFAIAEAVEEVHLRHDMTAAWSFVQALCTLHRRVNEAQLEHLAKEAGMHMTSFRHSQHVHLHERRIRRRRAQWIGDGVSECPLLRLQGVRFQGDLTRQALARALDDALHDARLRRERLSGVGMTQTALPDGSPKYMVLRQILVCFEEARDAPKAVRRTRDQALERTEKLRTRACMPGTDFVDLALRFGDGDVELGEVELASLPETVLPGVAALNIGDVSDLLEASDGFHVFQRLG